VSVSLSRVLLLRLGKRTLAVPASGVEGVHRLDPSELRPGPRGPMIEWRSELVPILPLGELLGEPGFGATDLPVVVLRRGAERLGISVERILGEVELVVRPLERPLRGSRRLVGAGVLPSGQLALVLNVADLMRSQRESAPFAPQGVTVPAPRSVKDRRALLVD